MLGLEPTRTNRLLKTLAYLGLAQQDERRKYRPGPGMHVLAAQSLYASGLMYRSLGPLESLREHGHIVAMGVLWRDQTCYLYHALPGDPGTRGFGLSRLYPAVTSGLGMALLAHQDTEAVRDLYSSSDRRLGSWMPNDPSITQEPPVLDGDNGLLARLARIRELGYALVTTPEDNVTLAVPIGEPPYAALGFSGDISADEVEPLVTALRTAAQQIEIEK
jgi:DNA-binding IclR family transcriptional regulator